MAEVIRCDDQGRLQALRAQAAINGIEYMVVVDGAQVPLRLRQRVLLLRLVNPLTTDLLDTSPGQPHLVGIRGGHRVRDPGVRWVSRLSVLDAATLDPTLPPHVIAYLDSLAASATHLDHWLVVLVEQPGDHSIYRLELRVGDDPPAGFDRLLSEIAFSFKVECPSPFDCLRENVCTSPPAPEPELDYLSRDFASFRRLMFDRLALIAPEDSGADAATLRAVLVEALAYEADRLAYFQDAVATETYLTTARTRPSVRRHSRLLGYPMHEGCNARTFVQLTVRDGKSVGGAPLAPGAQLLTKVRLAGPAIGADQLAGALAQAPEIFEVVLAPETFRASHNQIAIHTWGNGECCLPAGTTETWLLDDGLALEVGDFLLLRQTLDPVTLLLADADPSARHVVRLVTVGDPVHDDLLGATARRVSWHEEDALPFPLVVSVGERPVAAVAANLVLVDHGGSVTEPLALHPWGNQGGLRATLREQGLTWRHLPRGEEQAALSAAELLVQDPRQAAPELVLHGEGEVWSARRDLLRSPANAREVVVEMENNGRARVRFGDDVMGRRPTAASVAASRLDLPVDPTGTRFSARYRVGNGPAGLVGAGAIAHLVVDPGLVGVALAAALDDVSNPVPAHGAQDPETLDEVRRDATQGFRVQDRAVTIEDWIEMAERHPRVQRARARLRWTGSWHTVMVTVDPVAGAGPEEVLTEVRAYLDSFRLAGYDISVLAPRYVPLDIALTVCLQVGAFRYQVELALYEEFSTGVLADGRPGFFHPDQFSFGDSIWLSQIVARCMAVPGVRYADARSTSAPGRFARRGRVQGSEIDDGVIRIDESEVARCDNDPNAPEMGTIAFFIEGGT